MHEAPADRIARIQDDPRYALLVAQRSRFSWLLSAIMLLIFFSYIGVIAFDKQLFARPLPGLITSVGIVVGLGVILSAILLTAIYVWKANTDFDPRMRTLLEDEAQ